MADPNSTPHIPIELMELLNRINDNINEVKERIARIEAQDHSDSIRSVRRDIEKERNERIALQIELANLKTKFAPVIVGISIIGAGVFNLLVKTLS